MSNFAIPEPQPVTLPVLSDKAFPVRRIYCVGRNYADHAKEMGGDPKKDEPFFFMKPADAILPNGGVMPYPPATRDLQPEVELVVALRSGGRNIAPDKAAASILGYAVGLDMTRRDLQAAFKEKRQPWEMSKAFDHSAPCSAITPAGAAGVLAKGKIELKVNGAIRQSGDLAQMIWGVPQLIAKLSALVELLPGDLIFTGTPAGVGPVVKGDTLEASVAGLAPLTITIG
jgi:fumarylpyruvate hydrolase